MTDRPRLGRRLRQIAAQQKLKRMLTLKLEDTTDTIDVSREFSGEGTSLEKESKHIASTVGSKI